MTGKAERTAAETIAQVLRALPGGPYDLKVGTAAAESMGGQHDLFVPAVTLIWDAGTTTLKMELGPGRPGYPREADAAAVADRVVQAALRRAEGCEVISREQLRDPLTGEPMDGE